MALTVKKIERGQIIGGRFVPEKKRKNPRKRKPTDYVIRFDRFVGAGDTTGYNAWDYFDTPAPAEFASKAEAKAWIKVHHRGRDSYGITAKFVPEKKRKNPRKRKPTAKRNTSRKKLRARDRVDPRKPSWRFSLAKNSKRRRR